LPSYTATLIQTCGSTTAGNLDFLPTIPAAGSGGLLFTNTTNALVYTNGNTPLIFGTNGFERARITAAGNVGIGTASPGSPLDVVGNINASYISTSSSTSTTPTLSFNASNTSVAKGATVSGSYVQDVIQNKSATAGASANYVVSPNNGTDSTYYGEFGINSSVFSASTPADFFSLNNQIYFSGHDGDVAVGSGNGFKTYFPWGATAASAHVINASGALGFSTNLGTTLANSGTIGFGTSGQALITAGSGAAPAWGTLGASGGGTGVNNGSNTLTLGGAVTFSGAFTQAFTATAATSVTMPTSGTLLSTTATSLYSAAPLFGTGADGAVTISSGTTTITRDMQYTNLTINGSGSVNTNGYQIYVSGTLDLSAAPAAAIYANGPNNGIGLSFYVGPIASNGGYSQTGGTGVGAAGIGFTRTPGYGGDGGASGSGGAGTNAGGAAATMIFTLRVTQPTIGNAALTTYIGALSSASGVMPTAWAWSAQGGASGGVGGGDNINAGGSSVFGGGSGGALVIRARFINRGGSTAASALQAKGGSPSNGGNGASAGNTGGAGGSGGGGGGLIDLTYEALLGSTATNILDVSGGNGSSGGNGFGLGKGGNGGAGGNGGMWQLRNIGASPTITISTPNTAGTAGSTTSTSTGAAGGAGATVRGNL
jgi:hypothetical protein